ncbi:hypothetical protein P7D22_15215 [Lichenihabitans sp. Uapishka_5]|uniref:hypothetical protein n=1 Tax=Lichenihabitans sp. Uapishka_5 TaxID=3037302 RepID=UPI0029E7DE5C|nr:hypothetical protein [Lichenihabitans sp. Uapishka_5]MDX7952518.1 hypothetical protein [Lichenihabitans sp. Uapishka_5]
MPSDNKPADPVPGARPSGGIHRRRRVALAAALVGAAAIGAGATAVAQHGRRPVLVALTPAPVAAMRDGDAVAVKGQVAEIYGNKFILADDSGRTLVETGPRGDRGTMVDKSETVTVQGRFERGFVHAMAIQHGDGHTVILGPPGPPPPPGPLG